MRLGLFCSMLFVFLGCGNNKAMTTPSSTVGHNAADDAKKSEKVVIPAPKQ